MDDDILIIEKKIVEDQNSKTKYMIIKEIARGSYGIVVRAMNQKSNKLVALKLMNFDNMGEDEKQDALREINLMSKVKHPFILEYISFFFYDFE